jgi:xanthine permease XanP
MVALVTEAAKLPHAAAQSAIGLAMIAVAFMTIIQSLRLGPVGSGYLCPPVVSAIYLPSSLAAAASFGISAVCGMVIFAGACEIGMASLVKRTRKLFPAVVSGVVIMAVGLELGRIAGSVLFEHYAAHSGQTIGSFATVACALAAMTGLAVWGTGLPKLFCSLIGILVGYAAAAAFQVYSPDFLADFEAARFFAVPDPGFLSYSFAPSSAPSSQPGESRVGTSSKPSPQTQIPSPTPSPPNRRLGSYSAMGKSPQAFEIAQNGDGDCTRASQGRAF